MPCGPASYTSVMVFFTVGGATAMAALRTATGAWDSKVEATLSPVALRGAASNTELRAAVAAAPVLGASVFSVFVLGASVFAGAAGAAVSGLGAIVPLFGGWLILEVLTCVSSSGARPTTLLLWQVVVKLEEEVSFKRERDTSPPGPLTPAVRTGHEEEVPMARAVLPDGPRRARRYG